MAARTVPALKNFYGIFEPVGRYLVTKLTDHDNALDALLGIGTQRETVTASGAAAVTVPHTDFALSGTKAYTLAAGTKEGQLKTVRCISAASTPAGTLTAAFDNGGTASASCTFSATTFFLILSWDATASKWVVRYAVGATFA